jgi:hypothetical protein
MRFGGLGPVVPPESSVDSPSGATLLWLIRPDRSCARRHLDHADAVHAMLPNLRMILGAVIAACAVVLAASAGFIGSRDPARGFAEIPEVSRPLMQTAIMEEPEWQHFQLLASARRADELQRLLELPVTPVRAVVEMPEPAAEPVTANVPVTAQPREESGTARIALAAPAASPTAVATEPSPADMPVPVAVQGEPAAGAEAIPTEPDAAAPKTQLANVDPASTQTAVIRLPPKRPKVIVTPAPKTKAAQAAPRKKKMVRIARAVRRSPPVGSTGFPVELPAQTNQNALFNDQRASTRSTQKNQDTTVNNQRDR